MGEVQVENGDRLLRESKLGGPQGRFVLAHLVIERKRAVTQAELAEALWPDSLPASWPLALSAIVSRLRASLAHSRHRQRFRLLSAHPTRRNLGRRRGGVRRARCRRGCDRGRQSASGLRAVADRDDDPAPALPARPRRSMDRRAPRPARVEPDPSAGLPGRSARRQSRTDAGDHARAGSGSARALSGVGLSPPHAPARRQRRSRRGRAHLPAVSRSPGQGAGRLAITGNRNSLPRDRELRKEGGPRWPSRQPVATRPVRRP